MQVLLAVTRVLAGVALRSMECLHGAVTLPQFRLLAVLAGGTASRSSAVAHALGQDAPRRHGSPTGWWPPATAPGAVTPATGSVVTLQLTPEGKHLVNQVDSWRQAELPTRIMSQLSPRDRSLVTTTLRQVVNAAGEGYGLALGRPLP